MLYRGAGILMPISALWSDGLIGTLGSAATEFVDFLSQSGQKYWQVLPLGPVGYADSPYQPFSAFAGNWYYIDLERLKKEGLLSESELPTEKSRYVNYGAVYRERPQLLRKAFSRFKPDDSFKAFEEENEYWLNDFALFMAIKRDRGMGSCLNWPDNIRCREPEGIAEQSERLKDEIEFNKFCQYQFFKDWYALRKYANVKGVKLIGDMPIYVAADSSDFWVRPQQFEITNDLKPRKIAGVPPDLFSQTGQRWGNPLYNWEYMNSDNFSWWRKRMSQASLMFDAVRIDHFIGIARYFSISADNEGTVTGRWRRGPGSRLTTALDEERGDTDIIAENLGVSHPSVDRLLKRTGYHAMGVLEFAFDGDMTNQYLPHNLSKNYALYPATHDNDTVVGWFYKQPPSKQHLIADYAHIRSKNHIHDGVLRLAYSSVCDLAIVQMQDVLGLGSSARMNTPSTTSGNWRWRLQKSDLRDAVVSKLKHLTELYGR